MCPVLIIEDELLVALDLEGLLAQHGATTFAYAEADAIVEGRSRFPDLITSDVRPREGAGPRGVQVIQQELGPLPVIFITTTPEDCIRCDPPARVLGKPLQEQSIGAAFRDLAPV